MTVTEICKGIWQLNEETGSNSNVDAYLIVGDKRALLVDSLQDETTLYDEIRKITQLPVDVVITHGHSDHAGASTKALHENGCAIYMDLRDLPILKSMSNANDNWFKDIQSGKVFDLGGFSLEVITVPGHTPGSLVLLERDKQLLFTGDTIGSGYFWMQLPHSLSLTIFLGSLKEMWEKVKSFEKLLVYPGHRSQSPVQLNLQYVKDTLTITENLVSGEWEGEDGEMSFGGMDMKFKRISHGLMQDYLYTLQ